MGFDKCDSTPVQDYNGDNAKEHLLPQSCHVNRQKNIQRWFTLLIEMKWEYCIQALEGALFMFIYSNIELMKHAID